MVVALLGASARGNRLDLDLDFPAPVEQPGNDNHRCGRLCGSKALRVSAPDSLGVGG